MVLLEYLAFESPALDLDVTMFIQFGIFLLVFLSLRKFVLKPYFKAYDEREKRTLGAQQEARDLQEKAAEATSGYEAARQKAYAAAENDRRIKLNEANDAANAIIEKARREIQLDIAAKQAEFSTELEMARKSASPEIDAISEQIASKILV
ncbi:MAG: ATP synthase F0 subunit B [Proteobacteria bacterium]|nr:ATP synthase F0 subunit B [Pseudomonadota bacterium]